MNNRKTIYMCLAALLAAASATSCSIKEDRWPCPCWLVFDYGEGQPVPGGEGFTASIFREESAQQEKSATVSWESLRDASYDVSVSKGYKIVNIMEGALRQTVTGSDLLISEGSEADSLYGCVSRVACLGEEAVVPVRMDKQFATVFLRMENDSDTYPFDLSVRGEVDGVSLLTLEPHEGPFRIDCRAVIAGNEFRFRLPRQKDGSLLLELREKGAPNGSSPVETIPLGEYIIESGFDWTEPSLKDIYIGVDYARAGIRITVNDWETVMQVTEEI